jgi:ferric-dicitrate binding protein FerR (iron transport regulator)
MQHEKEILKWLDGTITDSELEELRNTPEFKDLEPIIKNTSNFKKPSFNTEENLEAFHKLKEKQTKKVVSINSWKKYVAIAASLVLIVSMYFIFSNTATTVHTQLAETTNFNLPDNSEVALNSDSEIEYSEKTWNTKRELKLQGEAFFKVSKGKTFDVITNQGTVTVVGTQFNVQERDNFFQVRCFEGKVKVSVYGTTVFLTPGKGVKLVDGELNEEETFDASIPDWLNNESNFDNVPFDVVVKEFERQFNIKVDYDKALANKKFTGGFSYANSDDAIESIAFPMNLKVNIKDKSTIELYE